MVWRCVWLAALLSCSTSCRTATFTGGTFYYPPGSLREDAEYRLVVEMVGAPGKAYTDRTDKLISLAVRRDQTVVLGGRHYRAVAGDLHCAVVWEQADNLEVLFYELPADPGTSGPGKTERLVFTLHFVLDPSLGEFREAPMPSNVTRRDVDPIRGPKGTL